MLQFGLLYVVTFRVYITFCVNLTFNVVTNLSFASDGELTAARGLIKLYTDVFLISFDKFNKHGERSIFTLPHPD